MGITFTGAKPSSVTQRGKTEPFEVQISRQDIAFHNQFELGCYTNNLGSTATGPIWEGTTSAGGLYVPPSTAVIMTIASSSASDTANAALNAANAIYLIANGAFDQSNVAYNYAQGVAEGANNFAGQMANSVNSYVDMTYAAQTYLSSVATSINVYSRSLVSSLMDMQTMLLIQ